MPLLKYICESCGHVFEELIFGDKKPVCPKCGSDTIKRYYQGKCYFGGGKSSGCSGGNCSCCKGCSG
ncbi:MAG: FmdB family zinc ribbon protein [Christensenellales bacterium]